jgi:hypothetical protein
MVPLLSVSSHTACVAFFGFRVANPIPASSKACLVPAESKKEWLAEPQVSGHIQNHHRPIRGIHR